MKLYFYLLIIFLFEYVLLIDCSTPVIINEDGSILSEKERREIKRKEKYDERLIDLQQDMKNCGAKFDGLEIKEYEGEIRGVYTDKDIPANEIIMQIPKQCLITIKLAKETEIAQDILNSNIEFLTPDVSFLALYILTERKNKNNPFHSYFDTLPRKLTMPQFWKDNELKYLKGSYLLTLVKMYRNLKDPDYYKICEINELFCQQNSLKRWNLAKMLVLSRYFEIYINNQKIPTLVPIVDMVNDLGKPQQTKWTYNNNMNSFTLTSLIPIQKDSQISDSYGFKSNDLLLMGYGFVLENNTESDGITSPNEVFFNLILDPKDPLYKTKSKYWPQAPVRVPLLDNEDSRTFFSLLRFRFLNENELNLIKPSYILNESKKRNKIITLNNEKLILEYIIEICEKKLKRYPTTLEHDNELLNQSYDISTTPPKYSNIRYAIIQVRDEKFIFHKLIELAKISLNLISNANNSSIAFWDHYNQLDDLHHFIEFYITDVLGIHYNQLESK